MNTQKDRISGWVRIYVNGCEKRYRADNKTQAKALYGRLKADMREENYFPEKFKKKVIYFSDLAKDRIVYADTHHKRIGDDNPRVQKVG